MEILETPDTMEILALVEIPVFKEIRVHTESMVKLVLPVSKVNSAGAEHLVLPVNNLAKVVVI